MEQEKKFWHICTAGLEKELIFKTEADYIFGMNCIPLSIADRAVSVKTFCLMDNHVHFIVHGAAEECGSFIKGYRRRLFTLADMSRAEICMKEINDTERNLPQTTIADLSQRRQISLFRSRQQLPGQYTVTADGLICPECYTDIWFVENLFRTPVRMLYFLSRNDSMEMELTAGILHKARYTDSELAGTVTNICLEIFRKQSPDNLSIDERYRLADILRKRFGLGIKQLARLTRTSASLLGQVFHSGQR